ncbi:MAG: hypothetical protein MZU97_25130 [Bacillus subtilis]|nr:hypothetical protein [Bacillus subtilis]
MLKAITLTKFAHPDFREAFDPFASSQGWTTILLDHRFALFHLRNPSTALVLNENRVPAGAIVCIGGD